MAEPARRIAVVLFNLGGPDRPEAVRPFLFNLFNDEAIIGLPQPLRWVLASLIAARRAKTARGIYRKIGGRSPILSETMAQAQALKEELTRAEPTIDWAVEIAMRYWHPFTREAMSEVKHFAPDRVVLLPLYPQFSTTTTASSLAAWKYEARRQGVAVPTATVRCYATEPGFIAAHVAKLQDVLAHVGERPVRILFSAHGLPQRIVDRGDPYPGQVKGTVEAVLAGLRMPETDWALCYQSRVGPLAWIGPSVEAELRRAGNDKIGVVVVPIAFVSEHSETLVELDMEYKALAQRVGVPFYERVPALGVASDFIAGLGALVRAAGEGKEA